MKEFLKRLLRAAGQSKGRCLLRLYDVEYFQVANGVACDPYCIQRYRKGFYLFSVALVFGSFNIICY